MTTPVTPIKLPAKFRLKDGTLVNLLGGGCLVKKRVVAIAGDRRGKIHVVELTRGGAVMRSHVVASVQDALNFSVAALADDQANGV